MFAVTDSHYAGYVGHFGFMERRKAEGHNIILDIVTEHIGKEAIQDANGEMKVTGDVTAP